ncbi:hypothetical protein [Dokdonella ginsengisoli]|uniref:Cation/multidrug efflux pump n=1 Tax=Dokdonella ginsengisoli TaxID=363846 RepID=A0ABV9QTJ3_9GAMM
MLTGMSLASFQAVLFGIAAVNALVAFALALRMRRRWRERRRFAATHRALWSLIFLLAALLAAFGGASLLGYRRLTAETTVATIDARQLAPQRYAVALTTADGVRHEVELQGDDWQLDARVIKWRSGAVLLGAPPLYQLDRVGGRYRDVAQEREAPRSVVALTPAQPLDLWRLKQRFPRWLPWVDADYGSAAYLPLVDGGRYTVTLSAAGGLVARPADAATRDKLSLGG